MPDGVTVVGWGCIRALGAVASKSCRGIKNWGPTNPAGEERLVLTIKRGRNWHEEATYGFDPSASRVQSQNLRTCDYEALIIRKRTEETRTGLVLGKSTLHEVQSHTGIRIADATAKSGPICVF